MNRYLAAIAAVTLLACPWGCRKAGSANPEGSEDINNKAPAETAQTAPAEPVKGADLSSLTAAQRNRFERLADKLPSPCGKAHSLRTSRNTDESCKRARYAVDLLVLLLKDDFPNSEVVKFYEGRYGDIDKLQPQAFQLEDVPRSGPSDARVAIVEFYDYGCPTCAFFKSELEQAVAAYPQDVAVFYKMFPLSGHPDSGPAAQAALAAFAQGKTPEDRMKNFNAMHTFLFKNQKKHKRSDLFAQAEALGLDMKKFEADYGAAAVTVERDKKEGVAAQVAGTPTVFVKGIPFNAPFAADYVKLAIEEAIALGSIGGAAAN